MRGTHQETQRRRSRPLPPLDTTNKKEGSIWNVERNRLNFVGPSTHPDMPVARAVRMAVSLPPFVQPVVLYELSWCDGGIVDIFPVRPVLDIEPAVDTAVAVNGFYPHEFGGEDVTSWDTRPLSVVTAASQVRTCQQAELAREHLARLRSEARTLLVEPVPYRKVAGTGFYEQFLDTREWPQFMRAGRETMLTTLRQHVPISRLASSISPAVIVAYAAAPLSLPADGRRAAHALCLACWTCLPEHEPGDGSRGRSARW